MMTCLLQIDMVYGHESCIYWHYIFFSSQPHKCRSEGPAQVFLIVLVWLIAVTQHLKRANWRNFILSYDNMCHLDNLKVAKKELPLPGDLKYVWLDIKKVIDSLHLQNHKDEKCHEVKTA